MRQLNGNFSLSADLAAADSRGYNCHNLQPLTSKGGGEEKNDLF